MSRARRLTVAFIAIALTCWLAIVVLTSSRHEFWRDEVRALSLVREADSLADLYALIKYDGHPVLWYLLLYAGASISDSRLVLPLTSIVVAFAAVALFLVAAPFSLWVRVLFIFSALPLYEYAVMARNYGITMLLLFIAAAWYPSRLTHPVRFGFVLALLANTNVHSALLTGLVGLLWARDGWRARSVMTSWGRFAGGVLLTLGGIGLCAVFALPRENTILTSVHTSLTVTDLARAAARAILRPGEAFGAIFPDVLPEAVSSAVLYLVLVGLVPRPDLFAAGFAALAGFGVFFRVAYPGFYRHQGLLVLFFLFLYWVYRESAADADEATRRIPVAPKPLWGRLAHAAGLYLGLLFLIVGNVAESRHLVLADIRGDRSSSRALGEFLRDSPVYRHAVIVAEPGFMLESLPYYAANPIYLPRERRYSRTVAWTTDSRLQLSLGELLAEARRVAADYPDRPVLMVLYARLLERAPGDWTYMYNATFTWTAEEVEALRNATREVAVFDGAYEDERYRVLELVRR